VKRGTRVVGGLLVVLVGAGAAAYTLLSPRSDAPAVDVERIVRRDLEAVVSASGTIQPQLSVEISSSVMGRVTSLDVDEGDRVSAGQFLLQIDPESLETAIARGEASLDASRSAQEQAEVAVETARINLKLAREHLSRQQELWELELISRETYDQAVTEVQLRESELRSREVEVTTAGQRIRQESAMLDSARYDLSQVTMLSPINGIVTRRNIEEGETVVVGTMNNPGTVLLTIADFSILEAEVEVDETDIPAIRLGQAAEITIDALPDETYHGVVTEIGNSPIQQTGAGQGGSQATNFKVVVTIDEDIPNVRPGFTCTADITTATRDAAVAVPIQATTVREVRVDEAGRLVRELPRAEGAAVTPGVSAAALPPRSGLQDVEGVFVVRNGRVEFTPIETGIAGDRHFEAVEGLSEGDLIVTGPFNVVRDLRDGDPVQANESAADR
jgi:HlyD family secretion protein